jgi:hypothetical protein
MTNVQLVSISFQSAGGRLVDVLESLRFSEAVKTYLSRKTRPPDHRWKWRISHFLLSNYFPRGQVKANKNPFRCERDFLKNIKTGTWWCRCSNITQPDHVASFFQKDANLFPSRPRSVKNSQVLGADSPNGIYLSEWVGSFTQEAIRTCRSSFYLIRHTKAFLSLLFLLISTFHRVGSVDHHSCQPSR